MASIFDKKPTRHFSKKQETKVSKSLGLKVQPNSGATPFAKGDVIGENLLLECKTLTEPRKSHTIKKDWLDKNRQEAFSIGKEYNALCFDFGDGKNYYIIDELLFQELLEQVINKKENN